MSELGSCTMTTQKVVNNRQQHINKNTSKSNTAMRGAKQNRPLLIELFDILPIRFKGITLGLLLSLIPSYLVSVTTSGDHRILAIVPLLGLIVVGYLVGAMIEEREES